MAADLDTIHRRAQNEVNIQIVGRIRGVFTIKFQQALGLTQRENNVAANNLFLQRMQLKFE